MNDRKQALYDELVELEKKEAGGISLSEKALIEERRTVINAELSKLDAEDQAAELQKKVEDEGIAFNVAGVDMSELPHQIIKLAEIIVKNDRKRIYAEEMVKTEKLIANHKEELRAAGEREANYKFQNDELQKIIESGTAANKSLIHENGNLRDHMTQVNAENADLETRLRNAAALLEEKDKEINRLTSEIQDMRATAQFGEKQAQSIIDVTPESVTEVQGLVDAIAKKYVASNPIGGNWHEVTAEDGTKEVLHASALPNIEVPVLPLPTQTGTTSDQFPNTESTSVEEPKFPAVTTPPLRGASNAMAEGQPSDQMDGTQVTREWVEVRLAQHKAEILAEITGEKVA